MVKILMVVPPENYRDIELEVPQKHFQGKGFEVKVASTRKGECKGADGGTVNADFALGEVDADAYDAVVFVGGPGTLMIRNDPAAIELAKNAAAEGKVVGAICWACTTLAKAGVLRGKKATVWVGNDAEYGMDTEKVMEKFGAEYQEKGVVVDGKFVTADGPGSAQEFAEAISGLLS